MKMKKNLLVLIFFTFAAALSFSDSVTICLGDGSSYTADLPADVAYFVRQNQPQIEAAIRNNNVTSAQLDSAILEINKVYQGMGMGYAPMTTITNGLENFSEDLKKSIGNSQLMQNVWAESWVGKFLPGWHMGFGLNTGVAQMNTSTLKETAKALKIDDADDIPETLVFPTIAADIRLGGIILPFDFGVSFMTVDSSNISALDNLIDPVKFDFFTIGFDARWAILKGEDKLPKLSVGAGYVFTKGGVDVSSDFADADLHFKSYNFFGQAQISKKILFLVPFTGVKLSYVKSNVNWEANAQWNNIMDGNNEQLVNLQKWGILPTHFEGEYEGNCFIPQVYAGIGFDIFLIDLTFSSGYDFANQLFSVAFSLRSSW